jgi:hypothetical protein
MMVPTNPKPSISFFLRKPAVHVNLLSSATTSRMRESGMHRRTAIHLHIQSGTRKEIPTK